VSEANGRWSAYEVEQVYTYNIYIGIYRYILYITYTHTNGQWSPYEVESRYIYIYMLSICTCSTSVCDLTLVYEALSY
jgi:hypothetical protein